MPLWRSDVHIDQALTNLAIGYSNEGNFVGPSLFPVLTVQKDSDKYFTFGNECFGHGQESDLLWNDGTDLNVLDYTIGTETYTCKQHGAAGVVTNSELRNSDSPLVPFRDKTRFLTDRLMLQREKEIATKATTQANYPSGNRTQLSGTSQWSDFTSGVSDPIDDIIVGADAVRTQIGKWPTDMVVSASAWIKLIQHPDMVDFAKRSGIKLTNTADVAGLFTDVGIQRVHVAAAIENTAQEGATDSLSNVWGKHAVLAYVAPNGGVGIPAYGYTFSSVPMSVSRTANPERRCTTLNAVANWAIEFTVQDSSNDSLAGYLIEDAVA